jgi:hypothetical protein
MLKIKQFLLNDLPSDEHQLKLTAANDDLWEALKTRKLEIM